MSLFEQLQADWKQAFKNRETVKKEILSYIIAQAKNKHIDLWRELEDAELLKLIQKEVKLREESIWMMETAGQDEDAAKEKDKIAVLQEYLPTMLTDEELKNAVQAAITEHWISDFGKQRGQLIWAVMKQYGAQVDGSRLNQIITSMSQQ